MENPRRLDDDQLLSVADELHTIGRALVAIGLNAAGDRVGDAAAEIDAIVPEPAGWWTAGFNGQAGRARLFASMLDAIRPAVILETGAFRGSTTAVMADQFAGPIYSCELDHRWYRAAATRLASHPNISLREMDSRRFLREVLAEAPTGPALVYLDAHWFRDLPLREELAIILASGRPAAIMIDDFAVPGDEGYGFDDYGPGRRLDIGLLVGLDGAGAQLFFPTLPAAEETGARRGCAVIGVGAVRAALAALPALRAHDWPAPDGPENVPDPLDPPDIEPLHRLRNACWTEAELARQRLRTAEAESTQRDAEAARAATEAALAAANARAGQAEAARVAVEAKLAVAAAAHGTVEADSAAANARASQAEAARVAVEAELAVAEARLGQVETARRHAVEQAEQIRAAFLGSTSWKVTAPLRQVTQWLRRDRGTGAR